MDRGDSAPFHRDEILAPRGWALLNYLLDARTGLGRFREFRISSLQLMNQLPDLLRRHAVDEILETPDVQDRVALYREHEPWHKEQRLRVGKVHGNLVVFDLRGEETIHAGNRFVVYALFPDQSLSVRAVWGRQKQNVAFAVGKSILARTSKTSVGALCLEYGGGGHEEAGSCRGAPEDANRVLGEPIARSTRDG